MIDISMHIGLYKGDSKAFVGIVEAFLLTFSLSLLLSKFTNTEISNKK